MAGPRRLVVLRHAKAASAPGLVDIERPLAERGEQDATAAGRQLRATGVVPDLVVCSTARRTRQTWDLVAAELQADPRVSYEERVYDNDVDKLLDLVRETSPDVGTLLLVGHNPASQQLASLLTGEAVVGDSFPTCALVVIDFDEEWPDVNEGGGRLEDFWTPQR